MTAATDRIVTVTAEEQAELLEQPREAKPLEPGEVAGPTLASLVSPGTELHSNYGGKWFPSTPGYAAVFRVEEVGSDVEDLAPGQAVFCTGPGGAGGHRSRQRVARETCIPLPEGLDPAVACHARLMNVCWSTLTQTAARPPEKVIVFGLGLVGNLGAQVFRAAGYRVMGVEPKEARRTIAADKGIAPVFAALPEDKAVRAGIALALECSSSQAAALDACKAVRKGGEVFQVGVPWAKNADVSARDLLHAVFRGYVHLRSGWEWGVPRYGAEFRTGNIFESLAAALEWLADGRVDVDGLYETASPADCQQVYQDLLRGRTEALSVVFDWSRV